jgi:DNA recombination protein RmuC
MLLAVIAVLFMVLVLLLARNKNADISAQLLDFKNQLGDIKTSQLDTQNKSIVQQQNLFLDTQKELRAQLEGIKKTVDENLISTQGNITAQLRNSNTTIGAIQEKLGKLEATTQNIQEIGKDISSLQNILKAPKLRGNLGEYLLEELLKEIFPASNYRMKYSFKNGTQVDAVIKLGEGIVPVDSKFPLESFQRLIAAGPEEDKKRFKKEFVASVKTRIDEIAGKYINPAEQTFDFAMMYIPSENVFYEIIINDSLTNKEYELMNYAIQKHVIPVSPNSFYAYLMALVYGLKGFRIEQQAKVIIGELAGVQEKFQRFYNDFGLVGKHLGNASAKYQDTVKHADRFNDQVNKITGNKLELLEYEEAGGS